MPRTIVTGKPATPERDEIDTALERAAMQCFATILFRLHRICAEAPCRRARHCTRDDTPCLTRHIDRYKSQLPVLKKVLAKREAAWEAGHGPLNRQP